MPEPTDTEFICTFKRTNDNYGCYVRVIADSRGDAVRYMNARHGNSYNIWDNEEDAGVVRFGLRSIGCVDARPVPKED